MNTCFLTRVERLAIWRISMVSVVWFCTMFPASAQQPAAPDATNPQTNSFRPLGPGEYNNWLELSVGSFLVNGNRAQFQRQHAMPAGPFGGVEDFHWEQAFRKKGLFSIDGRAIFDNHDYLLKLNASYPDLGYVQFGYREFRTWYDGSGGFFPRATNQWLSLYDDQMHVDRGEAWFEAGLRKPDTPEITFRYSHEFRRGMKDSTSWGDVTVSGVPPPNNVRGIVPSFWNIDEKRDTFSLDIKQTVSKTEVGGGLRYELVDNNDSRNERRQPGGSADRFVTQRDEFSSDMFNAHAFTETRFNEKVMFTSGYSFTKLDTAIGGSRIYGADYDPVYDPGFARRQFHDEGFLDLSGGSDVNQYVFNASLMLTPCESLTVVPSTRIEHQDQSGLANFVETDVGAPPAFTPTETPTRNTSDRDFTDISEALELRYTGVTNWVYYIRGEWLEGRINQNERQREVEEPSVTVLQDTDSGRLTQKYLAGANWYPLRHLNFAIQYYHKIKLNNYTHDRDSTLNAPSSSDRYPAYLLDQNFYQDDFNIRATWRPVNNLTLISRYDFQLATIDTRADFLSKLESGRTTSHIFSESISWAPLARLYLQGNVNYVLDKTETGANDFIGSATDHVVPVSRNNYWNVSAVVGYALDDRTQLQAQYFYYRADNYNPGAANFTEPYGAGAEEHGVTATLTRQITRRLRWLLRYGYFTNRDVTSGGHNNYDAHLVFSSLQYRF